MAKSQPSWLTRFLSVSAFLIFSRIAGAGAGFLASVILARNLAPEDLGQYFLTVSAISLGGVVAAMGYPSIMGRFASRYLARRESRQRRDSGQTLLGGFVRQARLDTLKNAMLVIPLVIAWLSVGPSSWTGQGYILACIALAIPAMAIMRINGSLGTALRHFLVAYLPTVLFQPFVYLGVLAALIFLADIRDWQVLVATFAVLVGAMALAQHIMIGRVYKPARSPAPIKAPVARLWRRTSRPFLVVTVIASFFIDLHLILMSQAIDPQLIAATAICMKMSFLFGFAVDVTHEMPVRDIGEAMADKNHSHVDSKLALINFASVIVAAAGLLFVLVSGEFLLGIFGEPYAKFAPLFALFMAIPLLRACFGPVVMMLTIVGAQRDIQRVYLGALALMVASMFALLPAFGATGGAFSALLFFLASHAALAIILYRKSGLRCDVVHSLMQVMRAESHPLSGGIRTLEAKGD